MKRSKLQIPTKQTCPVEECTLQCRQDCVPAYAYRTRREDKKIDVLYVGEAPGNTEAEDWEPFVGKTGTLLRKVIKHSTTGKLNYAFTNAVKCLPEDEVDGVRAPTEDEMEHCRDYLMREIRVFDPDIIVALGKSAVRTILQDSSDPKITTNHGTWRTIKLEGRERQVFITYHPSYVSRQLTQVPVFLEEIQRVNKYATGWRPPDHWKEYGESTLLKSMKEVEEYLDFVRRGQPADGKVAVDVETENLNKRYGNKLGLIQFATNEFDATCIPLDHPQTPFDPQEIDTIKALLRRLFTRKVSFKYWLAHNCKFEMTLIGEHILRNGGSMNLTPKNVPFIDTMAMAYLLNENKTINGGEKAYRLKVLAKQLLGFDKYDEETLAVRADGDLFKLPLECPHEPGSRKWFSNLADYGGMDAYVTQRIFSAMAEDAHGQNFFDKLMLLLEHLFSRTWRLFSAMERNGFWANLAHLKMLQDPARSPIVSRLNEIDKVVIREFESAQRVNKKLAKKSSGGHEPLFRAKNDTPWVFDIQKPEHKKAWLVEELKLEAPTKTDKGAPSVGKAFYSAHEGVPEVDLVAERAGLAKLQSSYISQLIEYIDPRYRKTDCQDGRIRADFHFASTVTGRGSSSNPNMQQQVRGDSPEKAAIKSIFQAEQPGLQDSFQIDFKKGPPKQRAYAPRKPENALVQLDFMTSEVRWWAILSQCPDLASAFVNGKKLRDEYRINPLPENKQRAEFEGDLHRQTASLMYGVPVTEVDKIKRTAAKSIVFGWMFGRGPAAIAAQIKKTIEETEELVEQFGNKFPVGRDYLHGLPDVARKHWFVESPLGRRRRFPAFMLEHKDYWRMSKDERKIIGECRRQAMNSPIQAASSDGAHLGAGLFLDWIEDHGKDRWLIQNVVHDSCVYQVPVSDLRESLEVAEKCFTTDTMDLMQNVWDVDFNCSIEVDFEFGLTWGGLQKWDYTDAEYERIYEESFQAAA